MTNEEILTELYKIKNVMEKNHIFSPTVNFLIEAVMENINLQTAKKQHKSGATSAAMRLLKWSNSEYPDFHKALRSSTGKQMLVNIAWSIILHDSLPIPTHDDVQKLREIDSMREIYENVIAEGRENRGIFIPAPSRETLKTFIAITKAKKRAEKTHGRIISYQLTDGYLLNAEYLLAIIEIIPDAVFVTKDANTCPSWNLQPVYFSGTAGEGVLLPMRPPTTNQNKGENKK